MSNTKKIVVGAGIAVASMVGGALLSYSLIQKMVETALDRERPKLPIRPGKRLSGATQRADLFELSVASAEKLKNSDCVAVEITAHDGTHLVGHWHKCENAERVMIAMHGWRSSWAKNFGAIADFWHENRCSVLYAEQRGQGESDGDYMGFGLIERYDCLDWIHWVNENGCSALPLYLSGVSMGASTVLMTAGLELPENVHGIMADCGYTSPHEIWKYVMKNNLHMPYNGITAAVANDLCRKKISFGSKDYSCVDAMKQCKVPVLFVHGTDDRFVPIEMTYENYKACIAPKRLLVVPGAGHGMSYLLEKERYEKYVKEFWQDFD